MADTKISALTAVTTPAATDELAVNQGGTSKKVTAALFAAYTKAGPTRFVVASNATSRNVLAADYVCDGTADEVQINQAITDVASFGGKVQLSNGTYTLATPILLNDHGLILEGIGWGDPVGWTEDAYGTTLYPAVGFTGAALIVAATGAFGTSNPVAACQIRNLMCDGGAGTTTPVGSGISGIQFSSFSGLVENVRVCLMSGKGLWVSGKTTASTWSTYDSRLTGLLLHDNTEEGLYIDNFAEDLQIDGVVCHHNKGDGIDDRGSSNQFINCHTYDNGGGGGANGATNYNIYVASTVARSKFINCKIEHAEGQYGAYIAGSEIQFVGCSFHNNGEQWGAPTTTAVTFTDAGDLVNQTDHRLLNGDAVQFSSITSTTGISINTTYYVVGRTSNTFQVASSVGGSALALTTNGSGVLVRGAGGKARGQILIAATGNNTLIEGCQFGIKNDDYSVGSAIEIDASSSNTTIIGCRFQASNADTSGFWNTVPIWRNGPIYNPGDASSVMLSANTGAPGEQRVVYLGADHGISSATGTRVIRARSMPPGTYRYRIEIIFQSSSTTVGPQFGMTFTGTASGKHTLSYPGTGTAANTGIADDAGAALTGQLLEANTQTSFSTTAGNLSFTGVATANANIHCWIDGIVIVTATGDLEFWHGSDSAVSTTVKAGTSMTITRVA